MLTPTTECVNCSPAHTVGGVSKPVYATKHDSAGRPVCNRCTPTGAPQQRHDPLDDSWVAVGHNWIKSIEPPGHGVDCEPGFRERAIADHNTLLRATAQAREIREKWMNLSGDLWQVSSHEFRMTALADLLDTLDPRPVGGEK